MPAKPPAPRHWQSAPTIPGAPAPARPHRAAKPVAARAGGRAPSLWRPAGCRAVVRWLWAAVFWSCGRLLGAEHHVDLVGDGGDLLRRGTFPADEAWRGTPQRGFRIGDPVGHLALEHRQAGVGELGTDVLGDDGIAGGLRQRATEQRAAAVGPVGEDT